jgi:hypothetical protein
VADVYSLQERRSIRFFGINRTGYYYPLNFLLHLRKRVLSAFVLKCPLRNSTLMNTRFKVPKALFLTKVPYFLPIEIKGQHASPSNKTTNRPREYRCVTDNVET